MSNIIRIKRGITGGVVPTGLTFGELAVNITDKKLFVGGQTGNTIELLASGGGGGGGGASAVGPLGSIQYSNGSGGLSASSGFSLFPNSTAFVPYPSQPSPTDTLSLIAATAFDVANNLLEVSPVGLVFNRHLGGGPDEDGGSVIEAVGALDYGDGLTWGNSLILRPRAEGAAGQRGYVEIRDADNNGVIAVRDNYAIVYNPYLSGDVHLNSYYLFTSAGGLSGGVVDYSGYSNGRFISLKGAYVHLGDVDQEGDGTRIVINDSAVNVEVHSTLNQYGGLGIISDSSVDAPVVQANTMFVFPNGQTATSIVTSFNGLSGSVSMTGDGGAIRGIGNNTIVARLASLSATGVASFSTNDFVVGTTGHVGLTSTVARTNITNNFTAVQSFPNGISGNWLSIAGGATFNSNVTFNNTVTALAGLTSNSLWVGGNGATFNSNATFTNVVSVLGSMTAQSLFVAQGATFNSTTTHTGVAAFNGGITANGLWVGGQGATFNTPVTFVSNIIAPNIVNSFNGATGAVTYSPVIATTSLTGVASFATADFTVSAAGAVAMKDVVRSVNGLTGALTVTGDGGALRGMANNAITARLAASGVTGVASFNTASFSVDAAGDVTIKSGGVSNAQLSNSTITIKAGSGEAGTTVALGSSFSITGTANQVAVSRSGTEFTVGIPNDIVIPGNLTVNGTVVTANVDNFVVEDPIFMLGTGNAADSLDLGFYAQYTSSGRNFAGFFRENTTGKFRVFTGLSGGAEPGTTVNQSGAGYTVATLVAKIDGGTF